AACSRRAVQDAGGRRPAARAVSRLEGGGDSGVVSMLTAPRVPMGSQTEIDPMKKALSPPLASYCLRNGRTRLWPRARFVFSVPRVRAARRAEQRGGSCQGGYNSDQNGPR